MRIQYKCTDKEAKSCFVFAMLIASIVKILLVQNLPIYAITYAIHDDRMMINMAQSLMAGEWLGPYSQMTLVKGIMYPVFMALCNLFGIPYLLGVTITYILACVLVIVVLSKIFKSKIELFIVYLILLWDPISMSLHAFQRVYRCSLTPAHILFLLASFSGMYLARKESKKKMVAWAILAGVCLGVMWNTREDGIWVIPLVVFVIFMTLIKICIELRKEKVELLKRLGVIILPILVFLFINNSISLINYVHYGIYTTNELSDSAYADFMKAVYSVQPNEEIDYVSVPRETIDRICDECPSLKKIEENITTTLDAWEIHGMVQGDKEVEHGWLFWALRDAVAASGYYADATTANMFYLTAANEIETAINNGRLNRREIMPSVMMAPWREVYLQRLIEQIPKTIRCVINYEGVAASLEQSVDNLSDNSGIRLYESLTNNLAIYPQKLVTSINGWMFSKDKTETWQAVNIVDKDYNVVAVVHFNESPDIYDYFVNEFGVEYENAKKCRFSINLYDLQENIFPLQMEIVTINGEKEYFDLYTIENEKLIILFDNVSVSSNTDINTLFVKEKIEIVNKIGRLYSYFAPALFLLGLIGYLGITAVYLVSIERKKIVLEECWVFLSGVIGSLFVLVAGISYTHISAYNAVTHLYLSAAYPLCTLFGSVSVMTVFSLIKGKIFRKEKNNES